MGWFDTKDTVWGGRLSKRFCNMFQPLPKQVVDLIIEKAGKADEIACNGVEMVREKVEESDKFVYDEYFADGVVFEVVIDH